MSVRERSDDRDERREVGQHWIRVDHFQEIPPSCASDRGDTMAGDLAALVPGDPRRDIEVGVVCDAQISNLDHRDSACLDVDSCHQRRASAHVRVEQMLRARAIGSDSEGV
jgi:hypothetical protein